MIIAEMEYLKLSISHYKKHLDIFVTHAFVIFFTVELRFNEPLYNEVLGITNDILQPKEFKS